MKKTKYLILIIFLTIICNVYAEHFDVKKLRCPSYDISKIITHICWKCVFPIHIGDHAISDWIIDGYNEKNTNNIHAFKTPDDVFCTCTDNGKTRIGFTVTMWYPQRLIEVVRKRWCMISLGGIDALNNIDNALLKKFKYAQGTLGVTGDGINNKFYYNVHYMAFPLFEILKMILAPECNPGGYLKLAPIYFSETYPQWNDDKLALMLNPEALAFANPLAEIACSADAVATSVGYGLETLFWCDGSQLMYPLTGNIPYSVSPVREAFHLAARATAMAFRLGVERKTVGSGAICGASYYPFLIKEQYRAQIVYPKNSFAGKGCVPFGRNTFISGWEKDHFPGTGEDYVFVLFQKITCCVGKYIN